MEDLERLETEILDAAEASGLAVFPALTLTELPVVWWPGEDWRGFLGVAVKAGVKLIYVRRSIADEEALQEHEEALADGDHDSLLAAARKHLGETNSLDVGFAMGGLLHVFSLSPPWARALYEAAAALERREEVGSEDFLMGRFPPKWVKLEEEARAQSSTWVETLLSSKDFIGARSFKEREDAAARAIPELGEWRSLDYGRDPRPGVVRRVVIEAGKVIDAEVRPRVRRDTLERMDELGANLAGAPGWSNARTKPERVALARQFLVETIGFTEPALVEPLVRAAVASASQ